MIKINLSPVRADRKQPIVEVHGTTISIDGKKHDLSLLEDGGIAIHPIMGRVSRIGDSYELTLTLPHGKNAPEETRFPVSIEVTGDGVVKLPVYDVMVSDSD